MLHSVAPLNAAVCNKSKAAFRLPTVRRSQRYEGHKEEEGIVHRFLKSPHNPRSYKGGIQRAASAAFVNRFAKARPFFKSR